MFLQFVLWVALNYVASLLQPKPKAPAPGQIDIPTVQEGRKIGVAFGSPWITGPHVFWWGDVRTTPIKSKGGKK